MPKDPEMVSSALGSDYKNYPKHDLMHETLKPLLGESIFTTNGELWERQRRMLDPAFANAGLKKVFPLMISAVKDMQARLEKIGTDEEYPIDQEMTHVTADIIMRTILSSPIKDEAALEIIHRFEDFQEKSSRVNMLAVMKLPRWLLPWDYFAWKTQGAKIRASVGDIISVRYDEFQAKDGKTDYGDILEALMQETDEVTGLKFTKTELIDQVVMLFLAGHETSASALSWTFYILAQQPETSAQLAAEAEATYSDLDLVKFAEIHKLKQARDVFRETLRLYPPVAFISRVASKSMKMGEKNIPEGSAISISPWLIHRHEDLWKNPNTFNPKRFSEGENKKCPGAYLPFSLGPRICIGAAFAQQEALLIISTVMRHFELKPSDTHRPDPGSRLTLRSLNGIILKVRKRTHIPEVAPKESTNESETTGKCPFSSQ